MIKFARDFGCVLDNACPQENVEGGMVEVGVSGGSSHNVGVLEGNWVIEEGVVSVSMSTSPTKRESGRRGGHIGGCGGRVSCGWGSCGNGGGCDHGLPSKRITVGEVKHPVLYLLCENCSDFFTLDQIVDAVCLATRDATRYQSQYYEYPSGYENGEL